MAKEDKKDKKNGKKDSNSFFKDFKAELKRVTWPTAKQMVNNTVAVISIVIVFAVVIFVLDLIFENINKYGVEGLKTIVSSSSDDEKSEEATDASSEEDDSSSDVEIVDGDDLVEVSGDEAAAETTGETPATTTPATTTPATTEPAASTQTTTQPASN